ncbi:MAG: hypothetical protein VKI83_05920, partial [Synechococcaceae cyanobacterium]|nr:hypothetical protein [Synechococcaceae cyanobacterium]
AGDCLHRILERLDLQHPCDSEANRELVQAELRRAALSHEPLEPLLAGLELVRTTPFGGPLGRRCIADLLPQRRLHELKFDLSLGRVSAAQLADSFRRHPGGAVGGDYARRLAALPIDSSGFLTGSIDLVFQDSGPLEQWWVVDWKSNWLGERDDAGRPLRCGPRHYGRPQLLALMADAHYPLQAHLYLVALHRYLQWRLPRYAPQQHLGGYAYVFLRGCPGAIAGDTLPDFVPGQLIERPPLARILALDAALAGEGQ